MRNLRSYYSSEIEDFLNKSDSEILGIIYKNDASAETKIQQSNTWEMEISILKKQNCAFLQFLISFFKKAPE